MLNLERCTLTYPTLASLHHLPEIVNAMVTDQVLIMTTVGYAKNGTFTKKLMLMWSMDLLLSPELQNLPVRIGMPSRHKSGARGGPVLGHKPAGLIANSARVTKCFWAHRASSPLRGLFCRAMEAFPAWSVGTRVRIATNTIFLLTRCRFGRLDGVIGSDEVEEARGPVSGGSAWALASGFSRERRFGVEKRCVLIRFRGRGRFGGLRFGCGHGQELESLQVLLCWEGVFHKVR